MSKRTIEIVTHTAPPTSSGRSGLFWGRDYAEACATFHRLCEEYPEHLIQQFSGTIEGKHRDLDTFIRSEFWQHNRPVGTLVTARPGMVDGIREIVTVVRLTDAQYNVVRTIDPLGSGDLTQGSDGSVNLTSFGDNEVTEHTITTAGARSTLTRGLDADGWQDAAATDECYCGASEDSSCLCGVTLDAVEAPALA